MQNLTGHPDIIKITNKIRERVAGGHYRVSDIVLREDGNEYQFVDLVMEGGGTLGIALVGYIHALEQANIRFLGMAGSSVGAIVALLAYSCGERTVAKGERLASIISDMNLGDMVDGKGSARRLSRLVGNKTAKLRIPSIAINGALSLPLLIKKLGLNPGDELYQWISGQLLENGIRNQADLDRLTRSLPDGLVHRETGGKISTYDAALKIVAADITTGTKVVFPDMAPMYWQEPDEMNPACFARASASIPAFFQPFTADGISSLIGSGDKWEQLGSFTGRLPDKVSFADGGLLSNFPIDLLIKRGIPRAPTFGARLGNKNRTAKDADTVPRYVLRLFNAMRRYADYDFIFKNPLYKQLITHIPTADYYWLDFNMKPEDQLGLFREGVKAGYNFLEKFSWTQYKELRAAEFAMYRQLEKKQD